MTFSMRIITPTKCFFEGEIHSVTVPLADGDWQLLAHHCPAVATVVAGRCRLDDDIYFETTGGTLYFADQCVLLCNEVDYADRWDETKRAQAQAARDEAARRQRSFDEYRQTKIALAKALRQANRGGKDK